ncbi:PHP domain-containing protein [Bacillus sp. SL00103]
MERLNFIRNVKNDIKPVIGLTASVFIDEQETEAYPLAILAKNNEGYQNLIKISSAEIKIKS